MNLLIPSPSFTRNPLDAASTPSHNSYASAFMA
jgi:hypothetical protein